jgi:hypothetical protein
VRPGRVVCHHTKPNESLPPHAGGTGMLQLHIAGEQKYSTDSISHIVPNRA